ncbi:hypothetical protein [Mesorhizobium marinum]|uniref:hypothetical protein n=1 Tax=Mesorhizobium marinum TaxID=3228790 RepID=UPI003467BF47
MTAGSVARPSSWLAGALAAMLPPPLPTLAGALLWGVAMGAGAIFALVLENWENPDNIRIVAAFFAAGGFVAFPFAIALARFLSFRRSPEAAFAAAFLSIGLATACATAAIYALDYRAYYAEWHADTLTRTWILQFVHTGAVAAYQFAVLGLRLYFPFGFVALLVASFWFMRLAR